MSNPGLMVSVSGVRGIVGQSLTPEVACRFARCYGAGLAGGTVLVGRDSRPSGRMLRSAVVAGLMASGCSVEDAGVVPTPTLGVLVAARRAAGAVQITASHNPAPWNGLKLFGPDGAVLPADAGASVARLFESGDPGGATWDALGSESELRGAGEAHLQRVLDLLPREAIRERRFRVLLDANGGAGGPLAIVLLSELGCDVIPVGTDPDGDFRHPPEPTPEHLSGVAPLVAAEGADLGLVLDPDADRLALIDETGVCPSEELTLALAVQARLAEARGPVVINMSTTRAVEDVAAAAGVACHRTPVGEANVVAGMREHSALIGGEGNGGVIDPRVGWVRDPFAGMGLILARLAGTGLALSELIRTLPHYHMLKTKAPLPEGGWPAATERLERAFPGTPPDRRDGLRFAWDTGVWLHVRPSNTEPIVRVIAEGPDADSAMAAVGRATRAL